MPVRVVQVLDSALCSFSVCRCGTYRGAENIQASRSASLWYMFIRTFLWCLGSLLAGLLCKNEATHARPLEVMKV